MKDGEPSAPAWVCLKVDVCTHDGMRDGVPRLLACFARFGVRAAFFLSFGPDESGKAALNLLLRRGFLVKMLRTRAHRLYGWRTALSGTLLPARTIAARFPDLVRRIAAEGHEVGVHGWNHRLWQDRLGKLSRERIAQELSRAFDAYEHTLGRRPHAVAAPAWCATRTSLEVQDTLGLRYASDMRGGPPVLPELDGYAARTPQIPTTQPCLEELQTLGRTDPESCVTEILRVDGPLAAAVVPVHAEVEGGIHLPFLERLLTRLRAAGSRVTPIDELAATLDTRPAPRSPVCPRPIPGRSGLVLAPAQAATRG